MKLKKFNDLSLLEKFLMPIGVFSAGFVWSSLMIENHFYAQIATAIMVPSMLGTNCSVAYRLFQENKNYKNTN